MPHLIGLYSPASQSGKTTLANGLSGHGYAREAFAGGIKAMLRALLFHMGERPEVIERMVDGDLKEVAATALLGRPPRHALRTLGTEWGRDCMGADTWVAAAMARAASHMREGRSVVLDDMRFINEAQAIRAAGGMLVRIIRPGRAPQAGQHASEGGLDGFRFDLDLANDARCPRAFVLSASAAIARAQGHA